MDNSNNTDTISWRKFFGGAYFTAKDLKDSGPTALTISGFEGVMMENEKTKADEEKLVLYFEEDNRGLVVNRTMSECMDAMFGEDVRGWVGKGVTLYCDSTIRFGAKTVGGVRIEGSPDIAAPVKVRVKLPKRRAEEFTMQKTKPSPFGALLRALGDEGLSREDFDRWATGNSRPPVSAMSLEQMTKAAEWIRAGGGAAVAGKVAGGEG